MVADGIARADFIGPGTRVRSFVFFREISSSGLTGGKRIVGSEKTPPRQRISERERALGWGKVQRDAALMLKQQANVCGA